MRMLLTVEFPHEPFNSHVRSGKAGEILDRILESIKPESALAGSLDRIPETQNRAYTFDKVSRHPKSQFVIIPATHGEVLAKADEVVIEWLRGL